MLERSHEGYMWEALKEAEKALRENEVPVGAIIIHEGRIIARAHNQTERLKDPTAHAEMIAITQAASYLGDWRLAGTTVYVTLEPCPMCAGALVLARVGTLVYGAKDPKSGACESLYRITADPRLNHRIETIGGVLESESAELLRKFFLNKRETGNDGRKRSSPMQQ